MGALCRETKKHRNQKVGTEKTPKIGSVLEVTTSCLKGKYGVEIGIESVNKDNSHSWVRISHGLNKLVTDFSNNKEDDDNEQETSEMQLKDFALKTNAFAFASLKIKGLSSEQFYAILQRYPLPDVVSS